MLNSQASRNSLKARRRFVTSKISKRKQLEINVTPISLYTPRSSVRENVRHALPILAKYLFLLLDDYARVRHEFCSKPMLLKAGYVFLH